MRSHEHDAVGAAGRGLGDDVERRPRPGLCARGDADDGLGQLTEIDARGVVGADDGDAHGGAQRAEHEPRAVDGLLALVEDDDAGCKGLLGVDRLRSEGARSALQEGDVAGGEVREVRGFAAARRRVGRVVTDGDDDVDRLDSCSDVIAAAVGHDRELLVLDVGQGGRRTPLPGDAAAASGDRRREAGAVQIGLLGHFRSSPLVFSFMPRR